MTAIQLLMQMQLSLTVTYKDTFAKELIQDAAAIVV